MCCYRNCAFVNFTNISNAIKAIEGIKNKPEYANLRIAHGKDRCANPPRSGPQGGAGKHHNRHGHGHGNNHQGEGLPPPEITVKEEFTTIKEDTLKEEPAAAGVVAAA